MMPDDPSIPCYIAQIAYMWEDRFGDKKFHAHWFCRGTDTVLGEASDPLELFLADDCEDSDLQYTISKVTVIQKEAASDWFMLGGEAATHPVKEDDGKTYFYQKFYDPDLARFEDPPAPGEIPEHLTHKFCFSCHRLNELRKVDLLTVLPAKSDSDVKLCLQSYQGLRIDISLVY